MMPVPTPAFIAHRGASKDAPENTLAAFQLAWRQKADAIETDIRLTADGKIVLMHDATPHRTGGSEKPITDLTLAEIRRLDAGTWKAPQFAGERIPTLAEALDIVPADKQIFIEIKCAANVLPEMKRVVEASRLKPANMFIIGFDLEVMRQAKQTFPAISCAFLSDFKQAPLINTWAPSIETLINEAKEAKLEGLDLRAKDPLNAEAIQKIHAAGLKIYAWTVNDTAKARELAANGIDGITTDIPGALRAALA